MTEINLIYLKCVLLSHKTFYVNFFFFHFHFTHFPWATSSIIIAIHQEILMSALSLLLFSVSSIKMRERTLVSFGVFVTYNKRTSLHLKTSLCLTIFMKFSKAMKVIDILMESVTFDCTASV